MALVEICSNGQFLLYSYYCNKVRLYASDTEESEFSEMPQALLLSRTGSYP